MKGNIKPKPLLLQQMEALNEQSIEYFKESTQFEHYRKSRIISDHGGYGLHNVSVEQSN
jgi:hypothetical protein